MATRTTAAKAAKAPTTSTEKPIFHSIGALFAKDGGHDLVLEREFLDALGFETQDNRRYSLHLKVRQSKSGREYTSVFLCDAPED